MSVSRIPDPAKISIDFLYAVASGQLDNLSLFQTRGNNPDIDAATSEDIIPWGGLYAWQSAAVAMEIISTNAADDDPAGTGARTVLVTGLDASWNIQTATASMNGVAAVALPGTWRRINQVLVLTVGSSESNVGTISVRVTAGAVIQSQVLPGEGIDSVGIYTVPNGYSAFVLSYFLEISRAGTGDTLTASLWRREPTVPGPRIKSREVTLATGGTTSFNYENPVPVRIVGPYDLWINGTAGANNTPTGCGFNLLLESTT